MHTANNMKQLGAMRYSLFTLLILSTHLLFFIGGCSKDNNPANNGNSGTTPAANEIFIQGFAFSPASKTISTGTTVKWINKDATTHTVTSGEPNAPSGLFDSGNISSNGIYSHTFNQAGVFKYFCNIHHSMTGTITVQ